MTGDWVTLLSDTLLQRSSGGRNRRDIVSFVGQTNYTHGSTVGNRERLETRAYMRTPDRPARSLVAVAEFTPLPNAQTDCGAHIASCSLGTAIFPGCKVAGA